MRKICAPLSWHKVCVFVWKRHRMAHYVQSMWQRTRGKETKAHKWHSRIHCVQWMCRAVNAFESMKTQREREREKGEEKKWQNSASSFFPFARKKCTFISLSNFFFGERKTDVFRRNKACSCRLYHRRHSLLLPSKSLVVHDFAKMFRLKLRSRNNWMTK